MRSNRVGGKRKPATDSFLREVGVEKRGQGMRVKNAEPFFETQRERSERYVVNQSRGYFCFVSLKITTYTGQV